MELLTYGMVRVGWATKNARAATTIGMSGSSFSFAPDQVFLSVLPYSIAFGFQLAFRNTLSLSLIFQTNQFKIRPPLW